MRQRIVRFIKWLVRVTGALAKRIMGAIVAGVFLGLAILLILTLLTFFAIEGDPVSLVRVLVGIAVLLVGTLFSMLVGFIWPGPFIALLDAFSWLPAPDGGGGIFALFDGDD